MDLESIRTYCLSLPSATEEVKWDNDLCFLVGGKMFCIVSLQLPFKCSFKVPDEAFEEMIQNPWFEPAAYLARAKWVTITETGKLPSEEFKKLLQQSYQLIVQKLTKKVRAELGLQ